LKTSIKVWHLEITGTGTAEKPAGIPRPYALREAKVALPEVSRFLYVTVGGRWRWYLRKDWTWDQWKTWLDRKEIHTWIAYLDGTPLGYFELESQPRATTEIQYFGLIPCFIGQGYGKLLLEDAIEKAWQLGGKRVWLHTCSLDHPRALDNYLARGFKVFKEESVKDDVPDAPLQPWQNADKPFD